MRNDVFAPHVYHLIAAWLALMAVLSTLLNGCVIIMFLSKRSFLSSSNYLLLSLALSNFLTSTLVTPVGAYANAKYWWTLDNSICQYYAFLSTLFGLTSMLHLVALAIEQWFTINMFTRQGIHKKKMVCIIMGLWLFSIAWSLFPFLGWSSYHLERGFVSCSVKWNSSLASDRAYIFCLVIIFFFFPILTAVFCYIRIYKEVQRMASDAAIRWGTQARPALETIRAKTNIAKMSFVMISAFLIAWSPYAIVSLYSSLSLNDLSLLLAAIPSLCAKLYVCCNPVIYFFMYRKFRVALKMTLRKNFIVCLCHLNKSINR